MAARAAPPNPTGMQSSRPTLRRSTKVHRETQACSGGHKGRPYALPSTRFVGRGAHTPPTQPAGPAEPASIATGRQSSRRGGLYGRPCRTAGTARLPFRAPGPGPQFFVFYAIEWQFHIWYDGTRKMRSAQAGRIFCGLVGTRPGPIRRVCQRLIFIPLYG